jgi:cbb3-type cytochrome oxidase subunit 3
MSGDETVTTLVLIYVALMVFIAVVWAVLFKRKKKQ